MIDRLSAAVAGRCRIEREPGQGGMPTVYLAEDLKHKRKVARGRNAGTAPVAPALSRNSRGGTPRSRRG